MSKQIVFDDEARNKIRDGVEKLAKAVKSTLGPKGHNVVLGRKYADPKITKDGVSVAREIELKDPLENIGAKLVKSVASKTSSDAGDGTTTATVLTEAIYLRGLKALAAGCDAMAINRGITKGVAAITARIDELAQPISTPEKIEQVGTIASNNDQEIGAMIAEAVDKIGRDGIITVDEGRSIDTTIEIIEGMSFDNGFLSPYFANNENNTICEFDDPIILLCDRRISAMKDILPSLELAVKNQRPLVVIAEDIDSEALAGLIINSMRDVVKAVAVKAPGYGDAKVSILNDIACFTGGAVIGKTSTQTLENITPGSFGRAQKVKVTKDATIILSGQNDPITLEARIKELRGQLEEEVSDFSKEKLRDRIARLTDGVARISVGGGSEAEMKERKGRIEDALSATRAAIESGILPGGGVALAKLSKTLDDLDVVGDELNGVTILRDAITAPLRQIAENAGVSGDVVLDKVLNSEEFNFGYNALTGEYGNLLEIGVIDPAKVTRSALQNAASVAGMLLTTNCIVADDPSDEAPATLPFTA